jgi:hypothetical protein
MFHFTPMQVPRSYVCYSSTSGLILQPLSVTQMLANAHVPQTSHMSCGEWGRPATILPVDDNAVSFTSVDAVQAAAAGGARLVSAEMCEGWKRMSESALWISSWTDFPKFAKDICYTMMSLCDNTSMYIPLKNLNFVWEGVF